MLYRKIETYSPEYYDIHGNAPFEEALLSCPMENTEVFLIWNFHALFAVLEKNLFISYFFDILPNNLIQYDVLRERM